MTIHKVTAAMLSRAGAAALVALPSAAHASFLPPALMDSAAMGIAWFVIIVMPIVGIALFWLVHILPEKFAEKRHHPQVDAIQTLCLLSLVFGGLLWPVAWLWAFTRPAGYQLAFGTDKHDSYFVEMGEKARSGKLTEQELVYLRESLDAIAAKGALPAKLRALRNDLDAPGVIAAAGAATEASA